MWSSTGPPLVPTNVSQEVQTWSVMWEPVRMIDVTRAIERFREGFELVRASKPGPRGT